MERLLVIWCPGLLEEQEDGRAARAFARVVEAAAAFSPAASAVRPGVCAVPTRGPSRYFGGDGQLARLLARALADPGLTSTDRASLDGRPRISVADGLFAAVLAARAAEDGPVVVPPGGSAAFLSPWPVETLDRPELADLLRRLGVPTLGAFAALPTRHVLSRLGADGVACHEVAGGIRSELPGYRVARRPRAGDAAASATQVGFWGGAAQAEARAERALCRLEQLVHPEGMVVGRLQGGRGPKERGRLVPWAGRKLESGSPGPGVGSDEPWPGQIPSPAPAIVLERPLPAALVGPDGDEVQVTAAGLTNTPPCRLSVAGGPWRAATAWAGPWPVDERWWAPRRRRRRARMQLVTETGLAYLLVREGAGWWVEGAYD
jgi:hypothetical protein